MKTEEDILWKLGVIPDDEGITILTTWKEDICKKQNSLIEWLDEECPHGTMTFDLSHDFADILRTKLDQLKNK